jgi:hypothetical protein
MPVFQFTYDWRDWRFYQVNNSTSTIPPMPPVFSGYFWVYLGIAIFLTLVTIIGWSWFTDIPKNEQTPVPAGKRPPGTIK